MLQLLAFTSNNIIATKADDQLSSMDYGKIHPLIHNILRTGKKVCWYLEIENFQQWSHHDFKHNVTHPTDFERICCVGGIADDVRMVNLLKPFIYAEINFFSSDESDKAKNWIKS